MGAACIAQSQDREVRKMDGRQVRGPTGVDRIGQNSGRPVNYAVGSLAFLLSPNNAVPILTIVAPSTIATSKSPVIPMLK